MADELTILRGVAINRVFTTAAAERAGIARLRLVAMAKGGELRHLTRGAWSADQPADAEDLHLLRTVAILGRQRGMSAATAQSALVAWGLPVDRATLERVHLIRETSATTRRSRDHTVWSRGPQLVEVARDPVLTTPIWCAEPAMAIVHTGVAASPEAALVAADAAVARGLVTPRQLEVAAAGIPMGTRGAAGVRRALADVDGRHESPGETRTAQVCRELGFDLEPQVWIGPWRVDFLVAGTRVIIEFDGAVKYDSKADLVAEKRREDDLRRRGHVLVRLMWADLGRPQLVKERIMAALALAGA
ncbi:endonuclease domain-containing protein [Janibacter sp. GS2]|uniref:endonuclease domain-containing protein n=1 Tax=Janibacter sp. GS2 TaxID=3442646 RepID=UPI003EB842D4